MYRHLSVINDSGVFTTQVTLPSNSIQSVQVWSTVLREILPSFAGVLELSPSQVVRHLMLQLSGGPEKEVHSLELSASQFESITKFSDFVRRVSNPHYWSWTGPTAQSFVCSNSRSGESVVWVHLVH